MVSCGSYFSKSALHVRNLFNFIINKMYTAFLFSILTENLKLYLLGMDIEMDLDK